MRRQNLVAKKTATINPNLTFSPTPHMQTRKPAATPFPRQQLNTSGAHEQSYRKWLYALTASVSAAALVFSKIAPGPDEFVSKQRELRGQEEWLKWTCIWLSTGFTNTITRYEVAQSCLMWFIQFYLETFNHTVFHDNKVTVIEDGVPVKKTPILFRGEHPSELDNIMKHGRYAPLFASIRCGTFGPPKIEDQRIHGPEAISGNSHGLVSTTTSANAAVEFSTDNDGNAGFAAIGSRNTPVAYLSQHMSKGNDTFGEYEVGAAGGFAGSSVVMTGTVSVEGIVTCRFNQRYEGNFDDLVLDPEAARVFEKCETSDPHKLAQLLSRENAGWDHSAYHGSFLAEDPASHRKALVSQLSGGGFFQQISLFNLQKKWRQEDAAAATAGNEHQPGITQSI